MLDKVEIEAPSLSKRLAFHCGKWFDKKKDDGQIERDLIPGEQPAQETRMFVLLKVTVDSMGYNKNKRFKRIRCLLRSQKWSQLHQD